MIDRVRVAGIDFSGARDAGKRIWIARGAVTGGTVVVEDCFRASELPGSGVARAAAMPALVEFLAGETDAVIGLDFPFGLPAPLIAERSWPEFVAGFAARHRDADAFRAACMAATGGRELKRRTDTRARTPFSAYNLRIYRQTYEGIRNVLAPLLAGDRARAIPMQPPEDGKPVLAEACPASVLKAEGLYGSYKGAGSDRAEARRVIIRQLTAKGLIAPLATGLRKRLVSDPGGDALDAVVAAIAAARAAGDPTATRPADDVEALETRVFF